MKELLTYILEKLCSKPEDIKVDVVENGNNIDIKVDVNDEDLGAVIGRGGRVANSIRTVVRSSAKKENKRVNISFK